MYSNESLVNNTTSVRHDDHDKDTNEEESTITAKVITMVVLFIASLFLSILPFLLNKWFKWNDSSKKSTSGLVMSILLAFGGGVLLYTTFMHLLPEVNENIIYLQESNILPSVNFHLGELLMCIGFFTMYLVEEIIHSYLHKHNKVYSSNLNNKCTVNMPICDKSEHANQTQISKNEFIENITDIPAGNHHHGGHSHLTKASPDEDIIVSTLRGFLIILALSVHELFEGLAVGLESSTTNVWYLFGAVAAHKLVLAFCVGMELLVIKTRLLLALFYVFTFAAVSPIGIGIGILLSETSSTNSSMISSTILQGLASGTLLYVVFFEILLKDRKGLIMYAAVVIGFAIMFGFSFLCKSDYIYFIFYLLIYHLVRISFDIHKYTFFEYSRFIPRRNNLTKPDIFMKKDFIYWVILKVFSDFC